MDKLVDDGTRLGLLGDFEIASEENGSALHANGRAAAADVHGISGRRCASNRGSRAVVTVTKDRD